MQIEERKNLNGYSLRKGKNIIKLKKLGKYLYEFEKFNVSTKNLNVITLLQEKFFSFVKRNKIEIMTENTARDRDQNKFMKGCGLKIKYSKWLFTRSLRNFNSPYKNVFKYHSISEAGIYKFFRLFKLSMENSIRQFDQFKKYLNKIKKLIKNTYDIDSWKVVSLNNTDIGIFMPHIFPENPKLGTLLEIGLKPKYRGKGYGRIIHAYGLELLRQMGAKKYLGSTEITNCAMVKVFQLNGCKKWFIRHFFYAN